jgi:hypothetical protein
MVSSFQVLWPHTWHDVRKAAVVWREARPSDPAAPLADTASGAASRISISTSPMNAPAAAAPAWPARTQTISRACCALRLINRALARWNFSAPCLIDEAIAAAGETGQPVLDLGGVARLRHLALARFTTGIAITAAVSDTAGTAYPALSPDIYNLKAALAGVNARRPPFEGVGAPRRG